MSEQLKKPSLVGFKPTPDDWKMVESLVHYFSNENKFGSVSVSGVLKLAIFEMHKKYIDSSGDK